MNSLRNAFAAALVVADDVEVVVVVVTGVTWMRALHVSIGYVNIRAKHPPDAPASIVAT